MTRGDVQLVHGLATANPSPNPNPNPNPDTDTDPNPNPRLGLADLQAFVACEAQAVGLRCTVLETVAYALTFCLFELVRDDGDDARGR